MKQRLKHPRREGHTEKNRAKQKREKRGRGRERSYNHDNKEAL
jgi:hypothetical protein